MDIENVGATLGALRLGGLFTICIDCFDFVQNDQIIQNSPLIKVHGGELIKLRSQVLVIGQKNGFSNATIFHPAADPGAYNNLQIRFTKIISVFLNTFKYVKKQRIHQFYDEDDQGNHPFIEAALCNFLNHLKDPKTASGVIGSLKTVFLDKIDYKGFISDLKKPVEDLEELDRKACMTVGWSVPFNRKRSFTVGDKLHVATLEKTFFQNSEYNQTDNNGPKESTKVSVDRVVICGPGGMGKTQLALELTYQARRFKRDYSIFWVSGADSDSFRAGYLTIARQLGIPIGPNILEAVKNHLSHKDSGDWILVLDQADNEHLWDSQSVGPPDPWIQRPIDCLPTSDKGTIIITCRSQNIALNFSASVTVNLAKLAVDRAVALLKKLAPPIPSISKNNEADATLLVGSLEYLPLAIAQAAALIKQARLSYARYSEILAAQPDDDSTKSLSDGLDVSEKYSRNPITLTWKISFDEISRNSAPAIKYLCYISCLEQTTIPVLLLPELSSRQQQEEVLRILQNFAFIGLDAQGTTIHIHSSVSIITRNWLKEKNKLDYWSAKVAGRMSRIVDDIKPENLQVWEAILPHAQNVALRLPAEVPKEMLTFLYQLASHLKDRELLAESEAVFRNLWERRKAESNPDEEQMLLAQINLAEVLFELCKYPDASKLTSTAILTLQNSKLEVVTKLALTKSALVIHTKTEIEALRYDKALKILEKIPQNAQQSMLPSDYGILFLKRLQADSYVHLSRFKEAEELQSKILKSLARKQVFPVEEQGRLLARQALCKQFSDAAKAESLAQEAYHLVRDKLGPHHPVTINLMSYFGYVLVLRGKKNVGLDLLRTSYKLGADVLLQGSRMDEVVCLRYARSLAKDGYKLDLAQQILEYAYDRCKARLGLTCKPVWDLLIELGDVHKAQKNYKEALKFFLSVYNASQKALGDHDPYTRNAKVCMETMKKITGSNS